MERHSGYEDIREQILNKNISSFHEFAQYVPKKVLARDLGMTEVKFQKCLDDHEQWIRTDIR